MIGKHRNHQYTPIQAMHCTNIKLNKVIGTSFQACHMVFHKALIETDHLYILKLLPYRVNIQTDTQSKYIKL